VADADLGVSTALLGVAETGSLLMGSNAQEDRLVGMLSRTHVVLLDGKTIVPSLNDAASAFRRLTSPGPEQLRYVGFVSGPSRTADIERVLTIGVQGPKALHIVVIEGG
jgi:L-lactate dehydrogenase complex protein LldG